MEKEINSKIVITDDMIENYTSGFEILEFIKDNPKFGKALHTVLENPEILKNKEKASLFIENPEITKKLGEDLLNSEFMRKMLIKQNLRQYEGANLHGKILENIVIDFLQNISTSELNDIFNNIKKSLISEKSSLGAVGLKKEELDILDKKYVNRFSVAHNKEYSSEIQELLKSKVASQNGSLKKTISPSGK